MSENKGKGRAGDDLAQLRGQLGRSTPVAQEVREEQPSRDSRENSGERGANGRESTGEKPRRITVDLDAERHRVLREFAFSERAKGTEILRALLDELSEDPELAARVRERLGETGKREEKHHDRG